MTKKQALKAVIFLTVFLWLLVTVTYIIRTNGDVKDRFTGFYAEKENTIDAILVGSSPVYPYYSAPALYGTRRCLSLRCGCFPCRTRNGRIRWYSRAE